jgi:hypothetical protein
LRLAEEGVQFPDLPVAAGQLAEQQPAHRVPGQPQELRRGRLLTHAHQATIHQTRLIDQLSLIDQGVST